MDLSHPWDRQPALEYDLWFSIAAAAALGPDVLQLQDEGIAMVKEIARCTIRVDKWLLRRRPDYVTGIQQLKPMFFAMSVAMLQWPDIQLAASLVTGFRVSGDIPSSGALRQLSVDETNQVRNKQARAVAEGGSVTASLTGMSAKAWVDSLEAWLTNSQPEVLAEIQKDVDMGLLGPELTREDLDKLHGPGGWRPIPRFVIQQGLEADGSAKWRAIDDEKMAAINMHTHMEETIVTVRSDYPAKAMAALHRETVRSQGTLPIWSKVAHGTADMLKGYKQLFPNSESAAMNTISYVSDNRRRYREGFSLLFGNASSVNHFNRISPVITSMGRRAVLIILACYFDDFHRIAWRCIAEGVTKNLYRLLGFFGVQMSDAKMAMSQVCSKFLGICTDATHFNQGTVEVFVSPPTAEKLTTMAKLALEKSRLTSSEASKICGLATWTDTEASGRPARSIISMVRPREHCTATDLTPELEWALQSLVEITSLSRPRIVHMRTGARSPLIIYTDAAEEQTMTCGFAITSKHMDNILVGGFQVPTWATNHWEQRSKQIAMAELIVAPIVALAPELRHILHGRDVIWFIDNTAALSALVRATSAKRDMAKLACLCSTAIASLQARVYWEWVRSKANVADLPSRGIFPEELAGKKCDKVELRIDWQMFDTALAKARRLLRGTEQQF